MNITHGCSTLLLYPVQAEAYEYMVDFASTSKQVRRPPQSTRGPPT